METKVCAGCGASVAVASMSWTSDGERCEDCAGGHADVVGQGSSSATRVAVGALVAAALPLVFSYRTSSTTTVTMTDAAGVEHVASSGSAYDYVAIGGGGIALVLATVALLLNLKEKRKAAFVMLGLAFVVGAYQLARGFVF